MNSLTKFLDPPAQSWSGVALANSYLMNFEEAEDVKLKAPCQVAVVDRVLVNLRRRHMSSILTHLLAGR